MWWCVYSVAWLLVAGSAPSHLNNLVPAHATPYLLSSTSGKAFCTGTAIQPILISCSTIEEQPQSEQRQPSVPSKSSRRQTSSEKSCSPNSTYLSRPSPPLISLFTPSPSSALSAASCICISLTSVTSSLLLHPIWPRSKSLIYIWKHCMVLRKIK